MRPCGNCTHYKVCSVKSTDEADPKSLCKHYRYISNAQNCLNKIKDEILGKDYYIADPVTGNQANEIIANEIISKYKSIPKLIRLLFRGD